jgi:hypothetical protein
VPAPRPWCTEGEGLDEDARRALLSLGARQRAHRPSLLETASRESMGPRGKVLLQLSLLKELTRGAEGGASKQASAFPLLWLISTDWLASLGCSTMPGHRGLGRIAARHRKVPFGPAKPAKPGEGTDPDLPRSI